MKAPGPRSEDAVVQGRPDGALAILGRRTHLGQPDQHHNPMMDEKGRVWFTARVRPPANPAFCKKGSDHPSAKCSRSKASNRHLSMYDPATGKFTLISTCFPTHHLIFAEDANDTLWTSAGGPPAASSAG